MKTMRVRRISLVLALFVLLATFSATRALAGGTSAQTSITTTSASVLASNPYRHYLLVTNVGLVNDAYCALGSGNAATTGNSYILAPGGSIELLATVAASAPGQGITGDVACITQASTTTVTALEQ